MLLPMQSWRLFAHIDNQDWPWDLHGPAKCGQKDTTWCQSPGLRTPRSFTCVLLECGPGTSRFPRQRTRGPAGRGRGVQPPPGARPHARACRLPRGPAGQREAIHWCCFKPCGSFFSYLSVFVQTFPQKQTPSLGSPNASAISSIRKLAWTQRSYLTYRCCWPSANCPP